MPTILAESVAQRLQFLYGSKAKQAQTALEEAISEVSIPSFDHSGWSERDCVLITYGDQVQEEDHPHLESLKSFLLDHNLDQSLSNVHLLPFCPYSSDDGFSVIDFMQIDPPLGTWHDVAELGKSFELMFDLVLNHISQHSDWFRKYLNGTPPFDEFFIEVDRNADVSQVTRPRSLPLLTPFETSRGARHLWTTFSDDQIDLNYASPALLAKMVGILLNYVAHGARIIRLDAVAYLWKQLGTSCIHLPQTHEVIRLFRDILQQVAPHVLLLTETNVPHAENVSYFGNGGEAQMVYQFSLPPLLLDALIHEDASLLVRWLIELEPPPTGTTFFNFTASHDGVGVRPLEGIASPDRVDQLADAIRQRGGFVSTRRNADGTDSPYELNVAYVDALREPGEPADMTARRFLTSQAIMLSLQGIPGIYFHSLVGTENNREEAESTGIPRRINRRKFGRQELDHRLASDPVPRQIFQGYQHLLQVRRRQPSFHPEAGQEVMPVRAKRGGGTAPRGAGPVHVDCGKHSFPSSAANEHLVVPRYRIH